MSLSEREVGLTAFDFPTSSSGLESDAYTWPLFLLAFRDCAWDEWFGRLIHCTIDPIGTGASGWCCTLLIVLAFRSALQVRFRPGRETTEEKGVRRVPLMDLIPHSFHPQVQGVRLKRGLYFFHYSLCARSEERDWSTGGI